jgi:hypothetical protein
MPGPCPETVCYLSTNLVMPNYAEHDQVCRDWDTVKAALFWTNCEMGSCRATGALSSPFRLCRFFPQKNI